MFIKEVIKKKVNGQEYVNARELQKWIGEKEAFVRWIKKSLLYTGTYFKEGVDYEVFELVSNIEGTNIKQKRQEYLLSVECACDIVMRSATAKGKQYREYLIGASDYINSVKGNK